MSSQINELIKSHFKKVLLLILLFLGFKLTDESFCQTNSLNSGSVIEKRILKGQNQDIKVANARGNLQWLESSDGENWLQIPGEVDSIIKIEATQILNYKCAIFDSNCDPVYSEEIKIIPFDFATISTKEVYSITNSSARCGGDILHDGNSEIINKGICWSLFSNPSTYGDHIEAGPGKGTFSCDLKDLMSNTVYFVRAYAVNEAGISYGNERSFKTRQVNPPTVETLRIHHVTMTTANCEGTVTYVNGSNVTSKGFCWNKIGKPTINDNSNAVGTGKGDFEAILSGLSPNTVYYLRAYATNSAGTNYGEQKVICTDVNDSIYQDFRDDNRYPFKKIGDQTWMTKNLAYLPDVNFVGNTSETYPRFYVYGFNGTDINDAKKEVTYSKYGVLYNGPSALNNDISTWNSPGPKGICPDNWHLPSFNEWKQLIDYLINNGYGFEGSGEDIAKSMASNYGWKESQFIGTPGNNQSNNNSSGFNALPSGIFLFNDYLEALQQCYFSSASRYSSDYAVSVVRINWEGQTVNNGGGVKGDFGLSVRCIKD